MNAFPIPFTFCEILRQGVNPPGLHEPIHRARVFWNSTPTECSEAMLRQRSTLNGEISPKSAEPVSCCERNGQICTAESRRAQGYVRRLRYYVSRNPELNEHPRFRAAPGIAPCPAPRYGLRSPSSKRPLFASRSWPHYLVLSR